MTEKSTCADCGGSNTETPRSHCQDWAQHPNWREQIPEASRKANEDMLRATGRFRCEHCREVFPVSQRNEAKEATLSPYPEDLDLCDGCYGGHLADMREVEEIWQEIEDQRREERGE